MMAEQSSLAERVSRYFLLSLATDRVGNKQFSEYSKISLRKRHRFAKLSTFSGEQYLG